MIGTPPPFPPGSYLPLSPLARKKERGERGRSVMMFGVCVRVSFASVARVCLLPSCGASCHHTLCDALYSVSLKRCCFSLWLLRVRRSGNVLRYDRVEMTSMRYNDRWEFLFFFFFWVAFLCGLRAQFSFSFLFNHLPILYVCVYRSICTGWVASSTRISI